MKFHQITKLPEFEKDIKRLKKKFKTIEGDLEIFIKTELKKRHELGIDTKDIVQIPNLRIEHPCIYKAKKFACRYLKGTGGRSGIRVIYAHDKRVDKIELIEIYYKSEKPNEDRERIKRHYKK